MVFGNEAIFLLVGVVVLRLFNVSSSMLSDDSFEFFVNELVN